MNENKEKDKKEFYLVVLQKVGWFYRKILE